MCNYSLPKSVKCSVVASNRCLLSLFTRYAKAAMSFDMCQDNYDFDKQKLEDSCFTLKFQSYKSKFVFKKFNLVQ